MSDERTTITTEQMDSICRAVKASAELLEGPVNVTFKFPMFSLDRDCPTIVEVMAFRCMSPECDGRVHVEIKITPESTYYQWSQERSDNELFGFGFGEEPGS